MFTMVIFVSKRSSELMVVRYFDLLQTPLITGNVSKRFYVEVASYTQKLRLVTRLTPGDPCLNLSGRLAVQRSSAVP